MNPSSTARALASIQHALDGHAELCGDPVRAILLNPWEAERLDWWEYKGLPIEADDSLPTGVVKIECLRETVRKAIDEFHEIMAEGESLDDAEARLKAKLDQLSASMADWWEPNRGPEWWRRLALTEPDLYRRMIRGEEMSLADRVRAEAAQYVDGGLDDDIGDDLEETFHAWQDAWNEMNDAEREALAANLGDLPANLREALAYYSGKNAPLPAKRESLPAKPVLRAPRRNVPVWHRFMSWCKRLTKGKPKQRQSSVRTALDRYGGKHR